MKRVTCNGRQCTIVDGQRVWLETPPGDALADIHYDQQQMTYPTIEKNETRT